MSPGVPDRLLVVDARRGELLAVIVPPAGVTADQALASLDALGDVFALLPPGAHPVPVN